MQGSAIDAAVPLAIGSRRQRYVHPMISRARRRARGASGMSLIEVIVALSLVAMMMTMAVITLAPGRELAMVRMEAAEIAGLLASARSDAIMNRRLVHVVVDPASNSVGVSNGARHVLAAPARLQTAGDERRSILFRPDGESSGGIVEVHAGNRIAVISVDWLSGRSRTEVRVVTAAAAS
jgi:general secretion pathway protein H